MNKILTFEGGQPFTTGDLMFLQDNYMQLALELVKGLIGGEKNCILSGYRLLTEQTFIFQGALFINGDIYIIKDRIQGTHTQPYICIRKNESEPRLFRDNQTRNIYLVDDAYMSGVPTDNYVDVRTVLTLRDLLLGYDAWEYSEDLSSYFKENVKGSIYIRPSDLNIYKTKFKVTITKDVTDDTNVLFESLFRDPEEHSSVVISENKAYIVIISRHRMEVLNLDGTPYNGPISLTDIEL